MQSPRHRCPGQSGAVHIMRSCACFCVVANGIQLWDSCGTVTGVVDSPVVDSPAAAASFRGVHQSRLAVILGAFSVPQRGVQAGRGPSSNRPYFHIPFTRPGCWDPNSPGPRLKRLLLMCHGPVTLMASFFGAVPSGRDASES